MIQSNWWTHTNRSQISRDIRFFIKPYDKHFLSPIIEWGIRTHVKGNVIKYAVWSTERNCSREELYVFCK